MSSPWPEIGLIALLTLINAALAGSEIALISLRDSQLRRLAEEHKGGRVLAELVKDPNRYLATIQIGITFAGFLASAAAAISIAEPLVPILSVLGNAAEPVAIVGVTLVLSFVTLVIGELAPKRLALQRSERWALIAARPIRLLAAFFRPAVWLLSVTTDLVVRLAGGQPGRTREELDLQELKDLVMTHHELTEDHQELVVGALELAERTLRQVRIPRPDVFVLDSEKTCAQAITALLDAGHSRAPVAPGRSLDQAVGIVGLPELLRAPPPTQVAEIASQPPILPETLPVIEALDALRQARQQMALIVDEHGGIDGIVTMEDLVEEVVGEIYDETDRDVITIREHPDGSLVVPGRYPIHDLTDIGIEAPEGDYVTVAGLILDRLGAIPSEPGDEVEIPGWHLTVVSVEDRAVTSVLFTPDASSEEA